MDGKAEREIWLVLGLEGHQFDMWSCIKNIFLKILDINNAIIFWGNIMTSLKYELRGFDGIILDDYIIIEIYINKFSTLKN